MTLSEKDQQNIQRIIQKANLEQLTLMHNHIEHEIKSRSQK